jgi:hypothetical protein
MLADMRKTNHQSGQALIMAVLVMLIIAVLAALFLAIIATQLRQSQRQTFTIELQAIAEAGLRYADHNLVHGPDGADWRPDPNPGTFAYGNGQFRLTVTYAPEAGDPYSRFIKLESLATMKGNPFLQRRMVAYKPILVTDYVRFVHNLDKSPLPASLGANVAMYLYENRSLYWPDRIYPGRRYKTVLDGPVRVNSDLTWHGDVLVNLSSTRGDNVAVAGDITHDMVRQWNPTSRRWDDPNSPLTQVQVAIDGGVPRVVADSASGDFTSLGGYYRDGEKQDDAAGKPRWVRYVEPPTLDAERYLTLTRDSGVWTAGQGEYAGQTVNTGWFGYGKGIYIDNAEHIKYNHDYEKMRSEWSAVTGSYTPDAVVIELNPYGIGGSGPPQIRLTWRGGTGQFRAPTGAAKPDPVELIRPYPQNGVIYAAGDVAVKGTLPPRIGSPTRYYDQPRDYRFDPLTGELVLSSPLAIGDFSRYYHLTIVCGGNIFIEQSILSPRSAALPGVTGDSDTKLALLARDSVVLNTSQFAELGQPATDVVIEGTPWHEVRPGRPLDVIIRSASSHPIDLYFTHTGQPNIALPVGPAGAAIMQLLINGAPYSWDFGVNGFYDSALRYYLFLPPPVPPLADNESNAVYPTQESIPYDYHQVTFTPAGLANDPQVVRFQVAPDSQRFYWVRDIRARIDVEIDAAIYAEHGSWFIIPGAWIRPPEQPPFGDITYDRSHPPHPLPGEPLDINLIVRGAVGENRTAPLADASDWVAKWRGNDGSWLPTSPDYNADLGISKFTLRYIYDMSLRGSLLPGEAGGPPRLPKLPVSPEMIAWGERI